LCRGHLFDRMAPVYQPILAEPRMFTLEKGVSPNVVSVYLDCKKKREHWFLLSGDRHHDNPHCNQELEKKHLDEALEREAGIIDIGDLFCAMQGKYDKRSNKSDIRPEHQNGEYLDSLVTTAAKFYEPYAKNIIALGYGNHECVDADTEVLTRRGWVAIPEVTLSDVVASLHPHNGVVTWAKPVKLHVYPHQGSMVKVEGRGSNMFLTENHRVAYRAQGSNELRYRYAKDIFRSAGTCAAIPVSGESGNAEYDLSDDQLSLAAWVLSDGSIPKTEGSNSTYIYQSKPEGILKIRGLLDSLGLEYVEQVRSDRPLPAGIKTMRNQHVFVVKTRLHYLVGVGKKRVLPTWVSLLSDRQFNVFLQSYIDGDGTRRKAPNQTATAIYGTKAMLDSLNAECVTHGIRSSVIWRNVSTGKGHYVLNVAWRGSIRIKACNAETVPFVGNVYCLTTHSGNFFMRRKGLVCVTGNCSILGRHETNLTERLAQALRTKTGALVPVTGYTGWVRFNLDGGGGRRSSRTLWHMHGYGGGGPVTQDTIQAQRQNAYVDGADIMLSGHVHQRWLQENMKVYLDTFGEVKHRSSWYVKAATYKEEYGSGAGGWHVGTGKPPKPLGAWWLKLTLDRFRSKGKGHLMTHIEITPTN
jgi:hypothetical protein